MLFKWLFFLVFVALDRTAVHRLPLVVVRGGYSSLCSAQSSHCTPLVAEHRIPGTWASTAAARGPSSCGTRAYLLHGLWNISRLGIEPMSLALQGEFLSTEPPGKSLK